jgi:transcriptional regulator with XRE-family HTH domain
MDGRGPAGSRRRLGAELRRLRGASGLHLDQVAVLVPCSTSKVSRLETGKGSPKPADVQRLMDIYGVTSDAESEMLLRLVHESRGHGWWEPYTEGLPSERFMLDSPGRYTALESEATGIRTFEITMVHGLLQTEEYMRAVIAPLLPSYTADDVDRLVALRLARQEALRRSAVQRRRPVGGPDVMRRQLVHLLETSALPNVTIRVLPFEAGLLRVHSGSFVLLDIPEDRGSDVVYVEGHAGEAYLDAAADVDLYEEVFADLLEHASTPAGSRETIERYIAHLAPPRKASAR